MGKMRIEHENQGLHGRLNNSIEKMKSPCSEDLYNLILDEDEDEFSIFEEVAKLLEDGAQCLVCDKTTGKNAFHNAVIYETGFKNEILLNNFSSYLKSNLEGLFVT